MNLENLEVIEALTADELQQRGGSDAPYPGGSAVIKSRDREARAMAREAYKKCREEMGKPASTNEAYTMKKACRIKVNNELGWMVKAGRFW